MKKLLLLPLLFLSFVQISQSIAISCKSLEAVTGDTVSCVQEKGKTLTISLSGIKAPKIGQPYAEESKNLLSKLIQLGEIDEADKISVFIFSDKANASAIGMVYREYPTPDCHAPLFCSPKEPTPVSGMLLDRGLAWYTPDNFREDYLIPREDQLEQQAKAAKRGLWADDNPIPPWEWRERAKKGIF